MLELSDPLCQPALASPRGGGVGCAGIDQEVRALLGQARDRAREIPEA